MKRLFFLSLVMIGSFGAATAQNMGYAYDFIKLTYKQIPLHAGGPEYDTAVSAGKTAAMSNIERNATSFFNTFDSKTINAEEGTYTAQGSYTYMTTKQQNVEHTYEVNYTVEVKVKKGKYTVTMRNFTMSNQDRLIDFRESIKSADKNNGICNQFLAFFHDRNKEEIAKVCKAINTGVFDDVMQSATASR